MVSELITERRTEMKLYKYANYEGDEGVIIANSLEEAIMLHKKEYPKQTSAYLVEEVDYVENRRLYCTYQS